MDIAEKFLVVSLENERLHKLLREILEKLDKKEEECKNLKDGY